MNDEEQYREIYRMLLRQISVGSLRVRITELATFVVRIQREVVHRDEEDALRRLENSLVNAFKEASEDPEYITEDEFVRCMMDVDKKAPWDHYDRFLKRTYESLKSTPLGIRIEDYIQLCESAFGIKVDDEMARVLEDKVGKYIDLKTFLNLSGKLE
ncbi:unnamed protein product [Blepharisma stoltei]|uniref:TerB family tellurite resistance protein n=1 Tax=Blepharisma stoltei TaxID=1481888 RepID=A0AAU9IH22_9CILI|nr:unnamed protein product [Blepharisma stoltei]